MHGPDFMNVASEDPSLGLGYVCAVYVVLLLLLTRVLLNEHKRTPMLPMITCSLSWLAIACANGSDTENTARRRSCPGAVNNSLSFDGYELFSHHLLCVLVWLCGVCMPPAATEPIHLLVAAGDLLRGREVSNCLNWCQFRRRRITI